MNKQEIEFADRKIQFLGRKSWESVKLTICKQCGRGWYVPGWRNCSGFCRSCADKGGEHSEETKRKISLGNKGKKCSEETKRKISLANTGKKCSEETKEKMRRVMLGKKHSPETCKAISEARKGKGNYMYGRTGSLHPRWKGGLTPLTGLIRKSSKYKQWRTDVFTRDDFTCQVCKKRGGWIEAHHSPKGFSNTFYENEIKNIQQALDCQEFWDVSNGKTLCKECHGKTKKGLGACDKKNIKMEYFNDKS